MSTKPRFLQDIEKKLAKNKENGDEGLEIYREVFTKLIENIHTFGPVMASVKSGYEGHIRYFENLLKYILKQKLFRRLKENNRYLEITNNQLYNEMRKFQDEISSDEEEEEGEHRDRRTVMSLVEKLRIKREKEKEKRAEKLRQHLEEIDKYKEQMATVSEKFEEIKNSLMERENKYDLLSDEFNSVQKNFSAYKRSREQV